MRVAEVRLHAAGSMHAVAPRQAQWTERGVLLQALGWSIQLVSYAPSDLFVESVSINGFAAFVAWQSTGA